MTSVTRKSDIGTRLGRNQKLIDGGECRARSSSARKSKELSKSDGGGRRGSRKARGSKMNTVEYVESKRLGFVFLRQIIKVFISLSNS